MENPPIRRKILSLVPRAGSLLGLCFLLAIPLQAAWTGTDLGSVGVAGTDSYNAGTGVYTIAGSGADIGGTADAGHYVYQTLSGDGELTARVVTISNTNASAKAGVMLRQSTAAGSISSSLVETYSTGIYLSQRTTSGGTAVTTQTTTNAVPYWVRVVKDGNLVSAYQSPDGVTWTFKSVTTLALSGPVDLGLVVSSHVNTTLCTATFDNITFLNPASFAPITPWTQQEVGTITVAGAVHSEQNSWNAYGEGSGITGTADAFHFAYQPLTGNGIAVVQVNSISTSTAQAGLVLRQDLTAGAAEAALLLNPTNGVTFRTRASAGATITSVAGAAVNAPYWLKLVRAGSLVTGYQSANGVTWTSVGSQTLTISGTVQVGVAITSNSSGVLAQSTLNNLQVIPNGLYLYDGQVSAGAYHNLYLQMNGTVWAWGANTNGQIGDGTTTQRNSPVQLTGLASIVQVSAGNSHSLSVKNDGTVSAWGLNTNGQLGLNSTTQQTSPTSVGTLSGIVAVSAGGSHSLALASDGTVWAWGNNTNGQVGDGTTTQRLAPVHLTTLSGIIAISAGATHSLALRSDGTVWSWGSNASGQLGDGTTTQRTSPVQDTSLSNVVAISAGASHSLFLMGDTSIKATGDNSTGDVGDGTTTQRNTPVAVTGLSGMIAVQAGNLFSVALKSDGTMWAWGKNANGQLGDGTTTQRNAAVQVAGIAGAVSVGAGTLHTAAITSDQTIWTWGDNSTGQLGDGTTSATPDDNANPNIPATGLSLWLRADAGVTKDGSNNVTQWVDQYAGTTVTQSTAGVQPTFISNGSNGKPALNFNGSQRLSSTASVPLDNDWTIIVAAASNDTTSERYLLGCGNDSVSAGQRGFGNLSGMNMMGLYGSYVNAGSFLNTGEDNIVEASYVKSTSALTFYERGQVSGTGTIATAATSPGFTVGDLSNGDYPRLWNGLIHEIVIYHRTLTTAERQQVEVYLANKYGYYNANATWPSSYTTAVQAEITRNQWNKAQADAYVAMQAANPTVMTNGLAAWYKADSGVAQSGSNVTGWTDQTGNNTVTQATGANQPTYVASDLNGKPALRFSGNQYLYNPRNIGPGLNADMTLIAVGSTTNPSAQQYAFWLGATGNGLNRGIGYYSSEQLFDTYGISTYSGAAPSANTFVVQAATLSSDRTATALYLNGLPTGTGTLSGVQNLQAGVTVGAAYGSGLYWQGDIAEVLAYDHQLSAAELQQVGVYLADKYGLYNPNATWPGSYTAAVQAEITRNQWNKSQADAYVAMQAANPTVMTNGLAAWFKADNGVTQSGSNVTGWTDQTGNNTVTQATGANQPTYVASDINGKPALRFSGNQYLFNPRNIGPGLNADMTLIAVSSNTNPSAQEYDFWLGATGTGLNRGIGYYASQQLFDTYNISTYGGSSPGPNTFVTQAATLNSTRTTTTLYLNGLQTVTGTLSGVQNVQNGVTVGALYGAGYYWQGDIAEVLVYDHQLSTTEMQQVGVYLAGKYNLYYTMPAPAITPNGGSFSSSASITIGSVPTPAVVRYTLDGSTPTSNSTLYTSAFNLTQSAPVSYAVFLNNVAISPVVTAQFYVADTGNTGMTDAWQNLYFGHTGVSPTALSPGGSGLTNLQAYLYGYNPTLFSTNGDGLSDAINYALGIAATNLTISADGLTNAQNLALGIDPFNTNEAPITPPAHDPNDHTKPVIVLVQPGGATLLP